MNSTISGTTGSRAGRALRLATLAAVAAALLASTSLALAGDRGDRGDRHGRNDRGAYNERRADRHYDRRRESGRRSYSSRRDTRFDSGSFFGGVILGSALTSHNSYGRLGYNTTFYGGHSYGRTRIDTRWPSRYYAPRRPTVYRSPAYTRPVLITQPTVVYETVVRTEPAIRPTAAPASRLLVDLEGRCFEVMTSGDGSELRVEREAEDCQF
jgi:hypothetical protein